MSWVNKNDSLTVGFDVTYIDTGLFASNCSALSKVSLILISLLKELIGKNSRRKSQKNRSLCVVCYEMILCIFISRRCHRNFPASLTLSSGQPAPNARPAFTNSCESEVFPSSRTLLRQRCCRKSPTIRIYSACARPTNTRLLRWPILSRSTTGTVRAWWPPRVSTEKS